ncbi:hypothetical protein EHQ81_12660 [Leptospira selangorensis]|uniref:Uncharacterized protein n=1 Tax=Leptospira selangorensis TaxID=2484982 RepID=A0A5F2C6S1_9LEPT|nr:hypothetical protein [Leptospira selangorensis]TGM12737.1 hypothetical protein EHQ81_12660 [Leptospira selangorensis]TGM30798.1 hypothetical protein EHQ82_00500 [Leptospira selangorensis]
MKSLIYIFTLISLSIVSFESCEHCLGCRGKELSPAECALLALAGGKGSTGTPKEKNDAEVSFYLSCVAPKE